MLNMTYEDFLIRYFILHWISLGFDIEGAEQAVEDITMGLENFRRVFTHTSNTQQTSSKKRGITIKFWIFVIAAILEFQTIIFSTQKNRKA